MIGGGGEKRTLRFVARYGDACNVFGDPAGVRHKIDVLAGHCQTEGRDLADITKTCLLSVVIAATQAEFAAAKLRIMADRGMTEEAFDARFVCGTVEQVAERLAEYFRVGADGILINMVDAYDLDAVRLAAQAMQQAGAVSG